MQKETKKHEVLQQKIKAVHHTVVCDQSVTVFGKLHTILSKTLQRRYYDIDRRVVKEKIQSFQSDWMSHYASMVIFLELKNLLFLYICIITLH